MGGGKNIKEMVIKNWRVCVFLSVAYSLSVGLLARGLDKRRNKLKKAPFFERWYHLLADYCAIPISSQISSKCAVAHPARLNPYYPYAVNRAVQWEGGLYFQVFCGGPGVHDGGLEDITVPYTLSHGDTYPEKREDGFFWLNAED